MATMINHADAIRRDVPRTPEFNEYPKYMTHPAFYPGDVGEEVKSPSGYSHFVNGKPIRFPPVMVNGIDDEEYYAAKGYVSQGKSDPAAFARAAATAKPVSTDYVPQEYPKWAGGVLVENAEEEAVALAARRRQLGINEPAEVASAELPVQPTPFYTPAEMDTPLEAGGPTPNSARLDAMEEQLADMRRMMADVLVKLTPPPAESRYPTIEVPRADPEPVLSKQQKAANTRKRLKAERDGREARDAARAEYAQDQAVD